jgi:hypothetical protein
LHQGGIDLSSLVCLGVPEQVSFADYFRIADDTVATQPDGNKIA